MKTLASICGSVALVLLFMGGNALAQQQPPRPAGREDMWTDLAGKSMVSAGTRYIVPKDYRPLGLDFQGMKAFLGLAPDQAEVPIGKSGHVVALPMPEGGFQHFRVVYSACMEAPLAKMFPQIRTYAGQGIEDPSAYLRMDATPQGFHAMVLRSGKSTVYIDPFSAGDTHLYQAYLRKGFVTDKVMDCRFEGFAGGMDAPEKGDGAQQRLFGDCQLRTYRLALSATGEYTAFHGGTVALAQAAQVTTINRVNAIYEREMAVHLNIIAN
ncbi:MAG: hypothetical protein RLZZ165_1067, partial [Bacteroidota bacterium]